MAMAFHLFPGAISARPATANRPLTMVDLLPGICYATGNQNERILVSWKEHYRLLNPMG
jgi:hypothetical protein